MRSATVLAALALALVTAGQARAAVVYVGTSGSDVAGCGATVLTPCATVSKAVSVSAAGDTVRVGPGRFGIDEPPLGGGIAVKKPLTFEGAQAGVDPRDPAVRTPAGPDETVLYDSNPDTKAGGLLAATTVSNVVVDGFTFTGSEKGSGLQFGTKTPPRDGYRIVNNIFYRNAVGIYPDPVGPGPSLIEHNLFAENGSSAIPTPAGNGNGLYSSEARNLTIRENLFRDNEQTLAIDTRTIKQGGVVGGGDVTFSDNVSTGGDGPVFASIRGLTIAGNTIAAGGGTRGLYLGGNEQDDVHVLRNTFDGFSNIGVYLRQANPATPENGDVELRQNTITHNGRGILLTDEGTQGRVTIEHNRIVYNAGGGLVNNDPDAVIDARHNWWGCNAGPGPSPSCAGCQPEPDPDCDAVSHPNGGSAPAFDPWMVLSLTATPAVQFAGDRSTLRASLDGLSDATTPSGPFFLTGEAEFGSTPAGTHTPPAVALDPANVSASSAYAAGPDDPDELRTTVDRQTLRIKISRPPAPDIVPSVTPDDPTLTPGERLELLITVINEGNAPARPVRACVRLSAKLVTQGPLCQALRRLAPGHGIFRRVFARVRRDACAGRLVHRLTVTSGARRLVRRAVGRVLAGPCGNAPCPAARAAFTGLPRPALDRPRARIAC